MSIFKKRFRLALQRDNASKNNTPTVPYDQKEKVVALSMVVTVCNRHQDSFFIDKFSEIGASMSITIYARSNPPEDIVSLLGFIDTKKDIILTITRSDYVEEMLSEAEKRFSVSAEAKGICFSLPITSVAGIGAYRFLADIDKELRLERENKEKSHG